MVLVNFAKFVILKILDNLFSMQNSLMQINVDVSKILKALQCVITFISNFLSESSIYFAYFLMVLAKDNVASFT